MGTLSRQKARRTYDRIGSWQNTQAFYEDRATGELLLHGNFESARSIFEFGCGTGRFAHRLFEEYLTDTARYRGVDLSPKMVKLARHRLEPYSTRAEVVLSDGGPPAGEPTASCDRFVSNYVFDLLAHEHIEAVIDEAHRMLRPDGLLCLTGLSSGSNRTSRFVADVVGWIHTYHPALIGGCRPVDLLPFVPESQWSVQHHSKVVAFGIASEVLIARRAPGPSPGANAAA